MTTCYRRDPALRVTALEGEGVVLHLGTRKYYSVSESGLDLLNALVEPRQLAELVVVLTSKYDVSAEVAEQTARAFLDHGCRTGLLRVEERA